MYTPGFKEENKFYTSYEACMDLVSALNEAIITKQKALLHSAPFICLITDESNDVGVHKKLMIYARCEG